MDRMIYLSMSGAKAAMQRQESLANAELEEAQALVNYQIALAELVAATGTALERNGIRFVVPEAAEPSP